MSRDVTSLAALEDLLSEARPRARRECHAIAEVLSEAVIFCRSRHGPLTDTYLQLKAALTSIRAGRPEDAARHIETALDVLSDWTGDAMPSATPVVIKQ